MVVLIWGISSGFGFGEERLGRLFGKEIGSCVAAGKEVRVLIWGKKVLLRGKSWGREV